MNSTKTGEWDARSRATDAYITIFGRMVRCLDALGSVYSGVSPRNSYFLRHTTLRTWWSACAQAKAGLPDADADTSEWTRWLKRHRELGRAQPDGLPADAAGVGLLAACGIWQGQVVEVGS